MLSGFLPPHEGGVERYSAAFARQLSSFGFEVHVASSDVGSASASSAQDAPLDESAVTVHRYPVRTVAGRLPIPNVFSPGWRKVRRALSAEPFDLVLLMTHHYVGSALLARAVEAKGVVWIEHVSGHIPAGGRLRQFLVDRYEHAVAALQRCTCTDAAGVSTAAAAWLEHFGVHTDRVVANAIDADAMHSVRAEPVPRSVLDVVFVGRLEPGKGWDAAIRIVRAVATRQPAGRTVRLTIAGGGTCVEELRRLAEDDPMVRVLGPIGHTEVMGLLRSSDVLLLPSRYPEGLPTVLLEAGAVGTPVVTFPAGGTTDLIEDGVSGRVVDDEQAAADALRDLLDDPNGAQQLGRALKERILAGFTWPVIVEAFLNDQKVPIPVMRESETPHGS